MKFVAWMNGPVGRTLRVAVGLVMIIVGLSLGGGGGIALAVVGLAPLAAGLFGVCLIAPLFKAPFRHR